MAAQSGIGDAAEPAEGTELEDEVHLREVRPECVGQAGSRGDVHAMPGSDASGWLMGRRH